MAEEKHVSMSVTRGLAELKTLKKRIHKLIHNSIFLSTKIVGRPWNDHSSHSLSDYQSLQALIARYSMIKNAIIHSNAVTKVTISGIVYTVAEAIARKESIEFEESLLKVLKTQRSNVQNEVEKHNSALQDKLDNLLETSFSQGHKSDNTDVKSITEAYLKNNKIEIIDPIKINDKINKLEDEIENFSKEVDFALSESNALTKLVF